MSPSSITGLYTNDIKEGLEKLVAILNENKSLEIKHLILLDKVLD